MSVRDSSSHSTQECPPEGGWVRTPFHMPSSISSGGKHHHGSTGGAIIKQIVDRIPEVRNATHYFAHDVRTTAKGLFSEPADLASEGDLEAHYSPHPPIPPPHAITDIFVENSRDGKTIIALTFTIGFAAFEVNADTMSTVELAADLVSPSPVLACKPITTERFAVLRSDAVALYDAATTAYTAVVPRHGGVNVFVMRDYVVVVGGEELSVYLIEANLQHVANYPVMAPAVAASQRWLVYCPRMTPDLPNATLVRNMPKTSGVEAVTTAMTSGIKSFAGSLWGNSPPAAPSTPPKGNVVVRDPSTDKVIAHFLAHQSPIQCMRWNGAGTLLATTSISGMSCNVFSVMLKRNGAVTEAQVNLMYHLTRGMTSSTITSISFCPSRRWIGLSTSVGTAHYYALPHTVNRCPNDAQMLEGVTLTASLRARSAPTTTPVNPVLGFLPPKMAGQGELPVARSIIFNDAGTLTHFHCRGPKHIYNVGTLCTENFSGPSARGDSDGTPVSEPVLDAKAFNRAQVLLQSHMAATSLSNFSIVWKDSGDRQRVTSTVKSFVPKVNVASQDALDEGVADAIYAAMNTAEEAKSPIATPKVAPAPTRGGKNTPTAGLQTGSPDWEHFGQADDSGPNFAKAAASTEMHVEEPPIGTPASEKRTSQPATPAGVPVPEQRKSQPATPAGEPTSEKRKPQPAMSIDDGEPEMRILADPIAAMPVHTPPSEKRKPQPAMSVDDPESAMHLDEPASDSMVKHSSDEGDVIVHSPSRDAEPLWGSKDDVAAWGTPHSTPNKESPKGANTGSGLPSGISSNERFKASFDVPTMQGTYADALHEEPPAAAQAETTEGAEEPPGDSPTTDADTTTYGVSPPPEEVEEMGGTSPAPETAESTSPLMTDGDVSPPPPDDDAWPTMYTAPPANAAANVTYITKKNKKKKKR